MKVQWPIPEMAFATVHLYENQRDIDEGPSDSYRGRTAMFKEDLQRGNMSLKLIKVKLCRGEIEMLGSDTDLV
jgi:hypothetical protein